MYDGLTETFSYWWPAEQAARERDARHRSLARIARKPRIRVPRGGLHFPFIQPRPAAVGR